VASSHQGSDGPIYIPITSMVIGIICAMALLDDSEWDKDELVSGLTLATSGLVLGVISLVKQEAGRGISTTGIVFSSIAIINYLFMF
jgi:hypothetical protein